MKIKKMNPTKGFKKAFTLVELIVVVAVIGILAVFMVPNVSDVLGSTNITSVKNDASNVSSAVKQFIQQTNVVPVVNIVTTTAGDDHKKIKNGGVTAEGFTAEVAKATQANKLYMIDMSLLTKQYVAIDTTKYSPLLQTVPDSSIIGDINNDSGVITVSGKPKKTSVMYVIDANLNIYPVSVTSAPTINTKNALQTTNTCRLVDFTNKLDLVGFPAVATAPGLVQDTTFKTNSFLLDNSKIVNGISVDEGL